MQIPHTKEEMSIPRYSLFHLAETSGIKPNTLQVMIKNGVIVPAIPSSGQGFPARFDYINLIEGRLAGILSSLKVNEHEFLRALLNSRKQHHPNKTPLAEYFRATEDFSRYLVLPGMRINHHAGEDIPLSPVWFPKKPQDLENFLSQGLFRGWVVIHTRHLREDVNQKLQEL